MHAIHRILLAAIAVAALPPAHAQLKDCTLNGESVNPDNGSTTRGKTGLMRCVNRETGELLREEELRDGQWIGIQRWFTRGKLTRERSVNARGNTEGLAREWNEQGTLISEGSYVNAAAVGVHRTWHADGQLKSLSFHGDKPAERGGTPPAYARLEFTRAGQLSSLRCAERPQLERDAGPCGHNGAATTELYGESGRVVERVGYERGKLQRHETFWESGKPRASAELVGGQTRQREYSREGSLASERVVENRMVVLEKTYGERETLIAEKRYAGGRLQSEAQWYLNGQRRRLFTQEDATTQLEQRFHDNGKPAFEGRYRSSERGSRTQAIDIHKSYDDKGQLRREVHHDDKGRPKRERVWNDSGQLQSDDELYEDGSRKAVGR